MYIGKRIPINSENMGGLMKKIRNVVIGALILTAVIGSHADCAFSANGEENNIVYPKEKGSASSDSQPYTPFEPEIIDLDEDKAAYDRNFDDSKKYDYTDLSLGRVCGAFDDTLKSTAANSIMASSKDSNPFRYGTVSCTVKGATNTTDNGIVFAFEGNTFEGSNTSYYFFFIGQSGFAHLGMVNNGSWKDLGSVQAFSSVDSESEYELKVVWRGSRISCYINDVLYVAVHEYFPISGSRVGIRAGASGVTFKNFTVTNDYNY